MTNFEKIIVKYFCTRRGIRKDGQTAAFFIATNFSTPLPLYNIDAALDSIFKLRIGSLDIGLRDFG